MEANVPFLVLFQNSYVFFVLPAIAYVFLFVVFDMKLLFLVWRGHYMREVDNPQDLRKKLTAFYIKFCKTVFISRYWSVSLSFPELLFHLLGMDVDYSESVYSASDYSQC